MESNSIQKLNFRKFLKSQAEAAKAQSFNTLGSFATRCWQARKGNGLLRIARRTQRISAVSCAKELELMKNELAKLQFKNLNF